MDFLKAEIASKRKALDGPALSNGAADKDAAAPPAKKYMRKGDIERMRKEDEAKAKADAKRLKQEQRDKKLFEGAKNVRWSCC